MSTERDWDALRDFVKEEILRPGGYGTQIALAEAMPSFGVRSLNEFLNGKTTLRASNLRKLEVALRLERNNADEILEGFAPRRVDDSLIGPRPARPRPRQPGVDGAIVRNASLDDLMRMQAAYAEVFGAEQGEEFLRRALQLRANDQSPEAT